MKPTILLILAFVVGATALRLKLVPLLGHGCRMDEFRYNDTCYTTFHLTAKYLDAKEICKSLGGIIAAPEDEDTFLFFQQLRLRNYISNFWIGLTDRVKEGEWIFSDESKISNFSKWYPGEPNNINTNQHCAQLWASKRFLWDDNTCMLKQFYICQFQGSACLDNPVKWNDYCYEIITELSSYSEAEAKCKQRGGLLACDKNQEIHDTLFQMLKNRPWDNTNEDIEETLLIEHINQHTSSWIGIIFKDGKWSYEDGSDIQPFFKWKDQYQGIRKHCAVVEYLLKTGNCADAYTFICQYPAEPLVMAEELQTTPLRNIQLAFFLIGSFLFGVLITMGFILLYKHRVKLLNRSLSVSHQILTYSPHTVEE